MKARVLDRARVLGIVDLLRQQGYEVLAPFCGRGRDTYFDTVTDANRDQIQIHLPNPYYPPKRYVLPHIEQLMKVRRANGGWQMEPTCEAPKRAIFGIRSCDVAGIWHLDRFYLGRDFRDIYYEKRRQNLFLVNVVCSDPERDISDECFCMCADTGPAARDHFDLQLMDLGGGEFMAVAGTPAGAACRRPGRGVAWRPSNSQRYPSPSTNPIAYRGVRKRRNCDSSRFRQVLRRRYAKAAITRGPALRPP